MKLQNNKSKNSQNLNNNLLDNKTNYQITS